MCIPNLPEHQYVYSWSVHISSSNTSYIATSDFPQRKDTLPNMKDHNVIKLPFISHWCSEVLAV